MSCLGIIPRSPVFTILALVFSVGVAAADPPDRVARISFVSGFVSFRSGSLDEWSTASVNRPLTIGDHLWVEERSRTELQLGSAVVRLGPHSAFSVLNLDDKIVQLRVTAGSLAISVRTLEAGEAVEIDTPMGAVSLLRSGFYRVDVNDPGDVTTVTARSGEAEITTADATVPVHVAESLVLSSVGASRTDARASSAVDDFETWCLARDRHAETVGSVQYVSRDMVGYQDLDEHGAWQVVADFGPVWVPRVAADWAPYRFGHWAWVEPWGWTWIDDASWGFAPFHYGRWTRLATGWAWMPGTMTARPVYAPALVAFVGGKGWRAAPALGIEPVAWFPLGPRETFVPAYRASPAYVQRLNVTHVKVRDVDVHATTVHYDNREVPGAMTAVPLEVFVHARTVAGAGVAVAPDAARLAAVIGTAPPVVPQQASIAGQTAVRVAAPPSTVAVRQVVVRSAPPPAPVLFAARRTALAAHPGLPVDDDALKALRSQAPQPTSLTRTAQSPGARPAIHDRAGDAAATPQNQAPALPRSSREAAALVRSADAAGRSAEPNPPPAPATSTPNDSRPPASRPVGTPAPVAPAVTPTPALPTAVGSTNAIPSAPPAAGTIPPPPATGAPFPAAGVVPPPPASDSPFPAAGAVPPPPAAGSPFPTAGTVPPPPAAGSPFPAAGTVPPPPAVPAAPPPATPARTPAASPVAAPASPAAPARTPSGAAAPVSPTARRGGASATPEGAAAAAAFAARHAQERVEIQTRQTAERGQLQAKHQQEGQATTDPQAKQRLLQSHQQQMRELRERHRREMAELQKRQQGEPRP